MATATVRQVYNKWINHALDSVDRKVRLGQAIYKPGGELQGFEVRVMENASYEDFTISPNEPFFVSLENLVPDQIMDEGIEILAGPFDEKDDAWEKRDELNPEGLSGLRTPKVSMGYNGKWYVIIDHAS